MMRGGRSYVSSSPAFSNDGKILLLCTGNSVSVFSTSTGLQVAALEGHMALVTSVVVVPATSKSSKILCYCWTSSLDGTLRYWDFSVPELVKKININSPVFSMVIPGVLGKQPISDEKSPDLYAYLSIEDISEQEGRPQGPKFQVRKCNLTQSRFCGGLVLKETAQHSFLTTSASGKFFGIRDKRKIHIWKVPSTESTGAVVKRITLHHTKNITVLAFHPTERIVAAGDVTGRILIWRGFGNRMYSSIKGSGKRKLTGNEEEKPGVRGDDDADSCSTWHWHSAEVNVLSFSSDGANLYSGGKEGVLVVWQLDTGKKKFLPRIGSPLLYFTDSPDPSLSSISCADNQIHLLRMPSMEIFRSISGIKLPCLSPEAYKGLCSGFAFDSTAGLVAIRTENYCIQLYSLFNDSGIYEVQVYERNHQPSDDVTVVITQVAISQDGSLMSTAEIKLPEEGIGGLVCLKFWALGSQTKKFSLSTIIYEPHRDADISALAFRPAHNMAVSASPGGDFKIWVRNQVKQKDQMLQSSGWTCHAVGSYKKKPMTAATFSTDGSVLAVAAGAVITLWDPEKNVMVAVIGETLTPITTLSFVGDSEYLVSASRGSKPQLAIWSMSKLALTWSYKILVEAVACTKDLSCFAVLALLPKSTKSMESIETTLQGRDGVILLFNVVDPVPAATWSVKQAEGGGLAFLEVNPSFLDENTDDGKLPQALLAFINGDHEYIVFDPYGEKVNEFNTTRRVGDLTHEETAGQFGYASIYGELPEFEIKTHQSLYLPSVPSERPWDTIFSGSSHNLPPLTKLCSSFLESLLEKRTITSE